MAKKLVYQSLFFVSLPIISAQTANVKWFETGGAQQPPRSPASVTERAGATTAKSQFRSFNNPAIAGWDQAGGQPPHPKREKAGAIQPKDDVLFVPPATHGGTPEFVESTQHLGRPKRNPGALASSSQFRAFNNPPTDGWRAQDWAPPHRAPEYKFAAIARGDDGTHATLIRFSAPGWEVQSLQPPHRRSETSGALAFGDNGNHAQMVAATTVAYGWWSTNPEIKRPRLAVGGIGGRSQFPAFNNPFTDGWRAQDWVPPHPRNERSGAIARGDQGNYATLSAIIAATNGWQSSLIDIRRPKLTFGALAGKSQFAGSAISDTAAAAYGWWSTNPDIKRPRLSLGGLAGKSQFAAATVTTTVTAQWGFEGSTPHYKRNWSRVSATKGRTHFAIYAPYVPLGFEPRPPILKAGAKTAAAIAQIEPVAASFVFVAPTVRWGFEQPQLTSRPKRGAIAALFGKSSFASFQLQPFGWHVQTWQPPHPRPERAGSIVRGDDGTQAQFVPTQVSVAWGYSPPLIALQKRNKIVAIADQGTFQSFTFQPLGWAVQEWQPPHAGVEKRGAFLRGDDGTQGTQNVFVQYGWPIQPWQPPHPRPDRSGALARGDDGNQGTFVPTPHQEGWQVQAWQPPSPYRAPQYKQAAIAVGDGGTQAQFANFFPQGWEVQSVQPPHPRRERAGAILEGIDGIDAQFVFTPATVVYGYEFQPPVLRIRPVTVLAGSDGQFVASSLLQFGWPVQSFQPPHRAPERGYGALARGDDGTYATFIRFVQFGWPVQPWQPPHRAPERKYGALAQGDQGNQARQLGWVFHGWPTQHVQPPKPKFIAAVQVIGDPGIQAEFIYVPPPAPTEFFTVSGSDVRDRFPTEGVSYSGATNYHVTRRTN